MILFLEWKLKFRLPPFIQPLCFFAVSQRAIIRNAVARRDCFKISPCLCLRVQYLNWTFVKRYSALLWVWFPAADSQNSDVKVSFSVPPRGTGTGFRRFCLHGRWYLYLFIILVLFTVDQLLVVFHIRTNLLRNMVAVRSSFHHPDKCVLSNNTICGVHCRWSSECCPLSNVSHSSSHSWVWEASNKKSILKPLCCLS